LHLACYQAFDDIGSVIHSHPVWATMFAIAHQPIPACIDEFAIYCGGDIRCADYAASATPEVGSNAVKALEGRAAALIANHGLVAVGPRPDKVLHITALVQCRSPTKSTPTSPGSTRICAPTRCSPANPAETCRAFGGTIG
jgi:L-fuculose-phosphate aldolase